MSSNITLPLTYHSMPMWPLLRTIFFIIDPILFIVAAVYLKTVVGFEHYWTLLFLAALTPALGIIILKHMNVGSVTVEKHIVTIKPERVLNFASRLPEGEFSMAAFSHITTKRVDGKHGPSFYVELVFADDTNKTLPVAHSQNHIHAEETAQSLAPLIGKPFRKSA